LQFSDRQLQTFGQDGIMGAHNFNVAPKFRPKLVIFSCTFCSFGRKFSDKKNVFRQRNLGGPLLPPATITAWLRVLSVSPYVRLSVWRVQLRNKKVPKNQNLCERLPREE